MRGLRRAGLALLVLLPAVLAAGFLWLRSSLPQTVGTVALDGLAAPVEIVRDADGIVTIRAASDADAYFALGFAHAQDRLFQMELMRRVGAGRLAEIVGEDAVDLDRRMRTLGLYRLAEANLPLLAPEVQAAAAAYSAGINAFLERRRGALPPEFYILRHRPEPWRPADSLVWGRLMAWQLSGNWRDERLRDRLARRLDPERLESLWPALPESGAAARSGGLDPRPGTGAADFASRLFPIPPGASNNWVVAGRRTASGRPLLANDLHLPFGMPIQWYLARIETPTLSITGATAPGVQFTLIGHNGRVAWGVTTTHSDTQDLFVEKLAPGDAGRYLTPDGPAPFATRTETIKVRGGADVTLTVRETRHGPVVSDIGLADARPGEAVALAWPALRADDMTAQAVYRLNRAGDAAEFRAALAEFHSPQQNFVFADADGAIGFVAAARVPVRKALFAGSQMPAPGWTGDHDWTGFLAFEALPQRFVAAGDPRVKPEDAPPGWIATANNRIVADGYPHFIAARWPADHRVRRIAELLYASNPGTAEDMAAMQQDELSLGARDLLPAMLADTPRANLDARAAQALALLAAWDRRMDRNRPEPLIFTAWLARLHRRIYADELGEMYAEAAGWNLETVAPPLA
ncbi:MAG TPA: penicillin acylase family protein, partial [Dongiaceae bacterium]|nr:penicillin acylase family protein [Dongiaceae bacterium]